MKTNRLVLLLIAAILLIGVANWSSRRRQSPVAPLAGTLLLPDLDVNAVTAIEIQEQDQVLRLARMDEVWSVTNVHNYPADFQRLSQRLLELRDVKIGQLQRGMSIDDADATKVRLFGARNQLLAGLTLGATRQPENVVNRGHYHPGAGRYLSRNDSGEVFLVKESLSEWDAAFEGWVDTQIVSIPANDIATIEMRPASNDDVVLLDRTSGSLKLVGLDESKEQFDSARASGVDTAFQYMRFNRIADPDLSPEEVGFATGHLFNVTLKNGDIYRGSLGAKVDGGRYFKVDVAPVPPSTNDAVRIAAEARVNEAQAKLSPWTFLISSYTADNMVHSRSDLISPKPAETNAPAEEVQAETLTTED